MKTAKSNIRLLAYGLCLAAAMYNCKTKDVDSLTPFTYTFKGIDDVTLPAVTPTAPAAVSVTAGSVAMPAEAAAVASGLASMSATGVVPASVQQASDNIGKAVSPEKAATLSAAITPTVLSDLASTGQWPANLKADVTAITSNPALKDYLPVMTAPTVNGKAVGGRTAAPVTVAVVNTTNDAGTDACKAAANTAFNSAKTNLDAQVAPLKVPITAAYDAAVAAANAEVAGCQAAAPKFATEIAAAQSLYDTYVATLNSGRAILGEQTYTLLSLLAKLTYAQTVASYTALATASAGICTVTKDAKIAAAGVARDTDLARVTSSYNSALATLTTALNTAVASCHNQGGGRKSADGQ